MIEKVKAWFAEQPRKIKIAVAFAVIVALVMIADAAVGEEIKTETNGWAVTHYTGGNVTCHPFPDGNTNIVDFVESQNMYVIDSGITAHVDGEIWAFVLMIDAPSWEEATHGIALGLPNEDVGSYCILSTGYKSNNAA